MKIFDFGLFDSKKRYAPPNKDYYSWGEIAEGETFKISSPLANPASFNETSSTHDATFVLPEKAVWLTNADWSAADEGFANLAPGDYFWSLSDGIIENLGATNQLYSGIHHFKIAEKAVEPAELGPISYDLKEVDGKAVISNLNGTPGEGNGEVDYYTITYKINNNEFVTVTTKDKNFTIPGTKPGDKVEISATYSTTTGKTSAKLDKSITLKKEDSNGGNNGNGNGGEDGKNPAPKPDVKPQDKGSLANTGSEGNSFSGAILGLMALALGSALLFRKKIAKLF